MPHFNDLPAPLPGNRVRFEKPMQSLQVAVKRVGYGLMAFILGKSEKTLRNETVDTYSPNNTHKAGFDDALSIMWYTGDLTPLNDFLAMKDMKIVPIGVKDVAEKNRPRVYSDLGQRALFFGSEVLKALEDGRVCDNEHGYLKKLALDFLNCIDSNIPKE